MLVDDNVPV